MTTDEILKRLDLKLGMKIIDTKPTDIIRNKSNVYTLVKKHRCVLVFENSNEWFFEVFYVLTQLGERFKVVENDNIG